MSERPFREGIATAIRALRAERGWTQRELCRRTDLSPAYLSELEAAQKDASADVLARLAGAFGIAGDVFLWTILIALTTGEVPGIQRRESAFRIAQQTLDMGPAQRKEVEQFIEFQHWQAIREKEPERSRRSDEFIDETEQRSSESTEERDDRRT